MGQSGWQQTFIALGSNLGDRPGNLREALRRLGERQEVTIDRLSSYFDNPAVGGPAKSPSFLNAVAVVQTSLPPIELLRWLLQVECDMGRVRSVKWEPRLIDLDLLLYGDRVIQTPELTLPHPLLHQRPFVLKPLAEVAPTTLHPVLNKTIESVWKEFSPH